MRTMRATPSATQVSTRLEDQRVLVAGRNCSGPGAKRLPRLPVAPVMRRVVITEWPRGGPFDH